MITVSTTPSSGLHGEIVIPGDKSISHRSLILASQAVGRTKITGLLEGEDILRTVAALRSLGVTIQKEDNFWYVDGVGVGGLSEPDDVLDMGNSGTGIRLMAGLVAPYPFPVTFTGDASLRKRPMRRIVLPLEQMGVSISSREGYKLPMMVRGNRNLIPIEYELPVPSAQVKSSILLAALNIPGKTVVIEQERTRDHTELMMEYLGVDIKSENGRITIVGQPELIAKNINVPSDPSSAAFFVVAALIIPDSSIVIRNILMSPSRTGLYKTLQEMGGNISFINEKTKAGEMLADIVVSYSELKGVDVPAERAASMIDEYPILAVAASVASGKTVMNGLAELRVKESDRLKAISDGLDVTGVKHEEGKDFLIVEGGIPEGGGTIKTHMDHRIAMSFLVLGMVSKNPVTVDDISMINTSFPNFMGLMGLLRDKEM